MHLKSLEENLKEIKSMDLRSIIERTGGVFVNDKQFTHNEVFGHEKTPSNFIYTTANGEQKWKRFKEDGTEVKSGDAVDYVRMALGVDYKGAIEYILGNKTELAEMAESKKQQIQQQNKEQKEKQRRKMFAIEKNSVDVLKSFVGINYLEKRGILNAVRSLKKPNFKILVNRFTTEKGEKINNICYYFNKSNDNNHRFMVVKGTDEKGNKNGVKLNYLETRPIIHSQEKGKPFIVCEGIEDALSGVEFGYKNFISLNSTSNVNQFLVSMKECPNFYRLNKIELCFDNDAAGEFATNKIKAACFVQDLYSKDQMPQFLKKVSQINDKNKSFVMKILKEHGRIEDMKDYELVKVAETLANNSFLLTGYGDYFKIKESECYSLLKELRCKDLNEMLVKVIKETEKVEKVFNNDIGKERMKNESIER